MLKKILKYLLYVFIALVITITTIIHVQGNFYKVNDDVYRSGQLNKYNLEYYIKTHNIKTILNLRGKSTKQYYTNEMNISNKYNIVHIDYQISNRNFLDFNKTSHIINIMKNAKKPLLIHCAGGADRTSLAAALYQYEIEHKSIKQSKEEFSLLYGHSPYFRKHVKAMDDSFDNYVIKKEEK
jgi:protein tyrosine/serine phosphatase